MNLKYGETFFLALKDSNGNEYKEELKLEAIPISPESTTVKMDLSKLNKELCGFIVVKFKKFNYSVPTVINTVEFIGQNIESKSKRQIEIMHPGKLESEKYKVFYPTGPEQLEAFENTK